MSHDEDPGTRRLARAAYAAGVVFAVLVAALALAPRAAPQGLPDRPLGVPSGQSVTLKEAFLEEQDDGAMWLRVRFLAPWISQNAAAYDLAAADMAHVCRAVLPVARGAERIVVSFSAAEVPFGEAAPGVIQFFEMFRPDGDDCIWEEF